MFSLRHYLAESNRPFSFSFHALTLLVWRQEGHPACKKNWVLICWWWWFDWSFVHLLCLQLSLPLPSSLAPVKLASPGSPGKMAIENGACWRLWLVLGITSHRAIMTEPQKTMPTTLIRSWRMRFSSRGSSTTSCSASFSRRRASRGNVCSCISGSLAFIHSRFFFLTTTSCCCCCCSSSLLLLLLLRHILRCCHESTIWLQSDSYARLNHHCLGPSDVPPVVGCVNPGSDSFHTTGPIAHDDDSSRIDGSVHTEMLVKAIWRHRMQENPSAAGAPPRTPLRELTALPQTP